MKWLAFAVPLIAAIAATVAGALPYEGLKAISASAYFIGVAGAVAGAWSFASGDRLRWAWLSLAMADLLGGLGVIWTSPPLHSAAPADPSIAMLGISIAIFMNIAGVVGLALFVFSWRELGLLPQWFVAAALGSAAVGVLVIAPSCVRAFQHWQGNASDLAFVVSSLGDLVVITMAGPLAASALSMRGGALAWPYLFLAAQGGAWLLFDASAFLQGTTQVWADTFFSILAVLFLGAAGYAHRVAIRLQT